MDRRGTGMDRLWTGVDRLWTGVDRLWTAMDRQRPGTLPGSLAYLPLFQVVTDR